MNSASDQIIYRPEDYAPVSIYGDGTVEGWLTTYFKVGCELDLRLYIIYSIEINSTLHFEFLQLIIEYLNNRLVSLGFLLIFKTASSSLQCRIIL